MTEECVYLLSMDQYQKLRQICDELNGGSDKERNKGHRLWLVLGEVDEQKMDTGERTCTAEAPMKMEDKDKYRWHHPDAVKGEPFFNLHLYTCPHCKLVFHS